MNNFISIAFNCAHCNREYVLGQDENIGFFKIDFLNGTISYTCPLCEKLNLLYLNNQVSANKGRRLPLSKGGSM